MDCVDYMAQSCGWREDLPEPDDDAPRWRQVAVWNPGPHGEDIEALRATLGLGRSLEKKGE